MTTAYADAVLNATWSHVLDVADHTPLLCSPLFFALVASVTEVLACVVFSVVDLVTGRVPITLLVRTAAPIFPGFLPFLAMWATGVNVVSLELPVVAPTLYEFTTQWIAGMLIGDFLHYWTHRALHHVTWLKHHVHSVHHAYEGPLFSWVVVQVHPLEVMMITCAIYAPFWVVAHPLVTWTYAVVASLNAVIAHSGYDGGWMALGNLLHSFGGGTSNDHQLHHDVNSTRNYGNVLALWDHLFGTYAPNDCIPVTTFREALFGSVKVHTQLRQQRRRRFHLHPLAR